MERSNRETVACNSADPVVGIVRSFSDEISTQNPNDTLRNALAAKVADDRAIEHQNHQLQQEWRRLFQDASSLAPDESYEHKLLQQTQELTAAWEKFVRKLPEAQQTNLRDKPPSLATLFHAVDDAQRSWEKKRKETRRGRFKGIFGDTCQSFNDYKATKNHEDIAEGVSDGLANLCDDIFFWRRQLLLFQDEPLMQRLSIKLYIVVFQFLVDIFTNWSQSSWDRFRHSFDRKFFDKLVASRRVKMAEIAERLNGEANLATQRHAKSTATLKDQETMFSQLWEKMETRFKDLEQKVALGGQVHLMVTDSGKDALAEMRRVTLTKDQPRPGDLLAIAGVSGTPSSLGSEKSTTEKKMTRALGPEDITKLVKPITKYVQEGYVEDLLADASNVSISSEIYKSLRSWTTQDGLPLWIEGPYDTETPSANTLIVAALVYTVRQSKVPVVFHFCDSPSTAIPKSREEFYTKQLLELVYSLIAQLAPQARKTNPEANWQVHEEQFKALNGSSESLSSAITLLEQLIRHRPHPLFVIIDGLNVVEDLRDRKHTNYLVRLLDILCEACREQQSLYKVCFTSAGNVDALADLVARGRIQTVFLGQNLPNQEEGEHLDDLMHDSGQ
ncbi:MAG: hypothetical protein Q9160_004135 [Pyrenula sp. 1 TL-2023]